MSKNPWYKTCLRLTLVCAAVLIWSCQAQEPPLPPAAAAFKKEVKICLDSLAVPLVEPVFQKDAPTIIATLEKVEPQAVKLCRMCPFQIGVLNQKGETLAVQPPQKKSRNFSSYDLITKTISSKKIQQQRFFLQDGSQLYIVCAPLLRQDQAIGLVAIAISADEAEHRWGIKAKDFLALDFNN